jgi:hypothetical protein
MDQNEERYIKSLETYVKQLEGEIQDYQILMGMFYLPTDDDTYQGA